ncbi:hypothetical protein HN832_00680 [archaeon]|jgi:archaellum component FlaC|nr:hypothetical protein [archaeon]MBT4373863.1 hypothetical protein [archaeon]MBT4532385.1 hypothetical protein [archaeon]MBT7001766.1 hypothetical protein [archaeon]MBT7281909.1 hypothetical protein [archaeon]
MDGDTQYTPRNYDLSAVKIRDLEEKQRIIKNRLLLIGENLIETKEETNSQITEIKKELELLKQTMKKVSSFLENISEEFSKFAKKEDIEILAKQAKMFQPMEFATKADLEKLK